MKSKETHLCWASKKFAKMYNNDRQWNYIKVWTNRFLLQVKKSNSHRRGITSFEYSNLRLFDKPGLWHGHYNRYDEQRVRIEFLKFMCNMYTKRGKRKV